jgi:hypothetical protein
MTVQPILIDHLNHFSSNYFLPFSSTTHAENYNVIKVYVIDLLQVVRI